MVRGARVSGSTLSSTFSTSEVALTLKLAVVSPPHLTTTGFGETSTMSMSAFLTVVVVLAVATPPDINMVPPAMAEMIPTASLRMRVLIPLPVSIEVGPGRPTSSTT